MQPNAYVGVDLSRSLSLRAGVGRIKALHGGELDATTVDVALAFTFGVAEHGPR
jgi:hypothetical protein